MHEISTEDTGPGSETTATAPRDDDQALAAVGNDVPLSSDFCMSLRVNETREEQEAKQNTEQAPQQTQSTIFETREHDDAPEEIPTPQHQDVQDTKPNELGEVKQAAQPSKEDPADVGEIAGAPRDETAETRPTQELDDAPEEIPTPQHQDVQDTKPNELGEVKQAAQPSEEDPADEGEIAGAPRDETAETRPTQELDDAPEEIPTSQHQDVQDTKPNELGEVKQAAQPSEEDPADVGEIAGAPRDETAETRPTQELDDAPEEIPTPQHQDVQDTKPNELGEVKQAAQPSEEDPADVGEIAGAPRDETAETRPTQELDDAPEEIPTSQHQDVQDTKPNELGEVKQAAQPSEEDPADVGEIAGAPRDETAETRPTQELDDAPEEIPTPQHQDVQDTKPNELGEVKQAAQPSEEDPADEGEIAGAPRDETAETRPTQELDDAPEEIPTSQHQDVQDTKPNELGEVKQAAQPSEEDLQELQHKPATAGEDQELSDFAPDEESVDDSGLGGEYRQRVNRLVSNAADVGEIAGAPRDETAETRASPKALSVTRDQLMNFSCGSSVGSPPPMKAMWEGRRESGTGSPSPMKAMWEGRSESGGGSTGPVREDSRTLEEPPESRYFDEKGHNQRPGVSESSESAAAPGQEKYAQENVFEVAELELDTRGGNIPETNEPLMLELRDLATDMLESPVRISAQNETELGSRQTYVRPESAQGRRESGERQAYMRSDSGHSGRLRPESGHSSGRSRPESAHSGRPRSAARPVSAHHRRRNQEKAMERRPMEELEESGRLSAATTYAPTASFPLLDDDGRQMRLPSDPTSIGPDDGVDDIASSEEMPTPAESNEWVGPGRRRRTRRQLSASVPETSFVESDVASSPDPDRARRWPDSPQQDSGRKTAFTRIRAGNRARSSPTMRSDLWMEAAEEDESGIVDLDPLSPSESPGGERRRRRRRGGREASISPAENWGGAGGPWASMPMPQRGEVSLSVERGDETASPPRAITVYPRISEVHADCSFINGDSADIYGPTQAMTKAFVFGPSSPPARRKVYVDPQRPTTPERRPLCQLLTRPTERASDAILSQNREAGELTRANAGHRDRFAVTCTGPGPAAYLPRPEVLADATRHPLPPRTVFRKAAADFVLGVHNGVPAPGTYSVIAPAGARSRAMRCMPTRSSPSAAFSKDPRVCTLGGGMGIKSRHSAKNADKVRYDDIRCTPFREWH